MNYVDRSQCLQRSLPRPHPLDKKLKFETEDAAENLVLQEVVELLKYDASRYPVDSKKKKRKKKKRKIQEVTIEKFTDDELASARKLISKEVVRTFFLPAISIMYSDSNSMICHTCLPFLCSLLGADASSLYRPSRAQKKRARLASPEAVNEVHAECYKEVRYLPTRKAFAAWSQSRKPEKLQALEHEFDKVVSRRM